jgi:two-component system, cell cycle sensor histidine kinase and response regulator CckA
MSTTGASLPLHDSHYPWCPTGSPEEGPGAGPKIDVMARMAFVDNPSEVILARPIHHWWRLVTCLVILASFFAASPSPADAQAGSNKKKVLVLHSYNYGYGWTDSITKGIESVLTPDNYLLSVEYMDTKRREDDQYFSKLLDIYAYKFADTVFDIVIASDDNAFSFLLKYKNALFAEYVPIVFCGVNYFKDMDIFGRNDITGIVEEYDIKSTIGIIKNIHNNINEIIIISDKTATGIANTKKANEIFSNDFPGWKYTILDDLSMTELLEKVGSLPAGSVVLYLGFARDKTGQSLAPLEESLAAISNKSKAPLYSVWEFTLQSVVGGMITSGFYQGQMAAQMARRILAGERAADIPVLKQSPNIPMFNYQQMVRFGISRSQLPVESLLIHAPETSYPVEMRVIIIVTLVLVTLVLAVVVLFINIRKRRQAEVAAQIEKEKYRVLVRQVPGIVFKGHVDYGLDTFDDKIEALTGYTQGEFNSRAIKWNDVMLEEYVAPVREQLKKAINNDGFYVSEFRIRKKSGEVIWVQARNQVVKNAQGRMEYISGVFFDITEHKHAEEELTRLASVVHHSRELVNLATPNGTMVFLNNAGQEMLGISEEGVAQTNILQVIPEHLLDKVRQEVLPAVAVDGYWEGDLQYRNLETGDLTDVHAIAFRIADPETGALQFIANVSLDITDRKRMEEALRQSEEKYRQLYAEAKRTAEVYRSLLSSSPDAIVIYDLEGKVQFLSPSFTRIFGWTLDELAGKKTPFVPDSEREASLAEIRRVIAGNPCSNFETRRHGKDGRTLNITLSASRFDDHEGNPAGMLVILRDVSQTKAMETQYRQAQKMEAVGTLAGGVAHDFNNLLQAISGYNELLLLNKTENDADHGKLMQIKKACDRAAQLIRQLLAFSRKVEGARRRLDLNQEVLEAERVLQRTIPKMIAIELRLAGFLWSVHADPVQIEQILLNLGSNAADAMPDGGRLTIETLNVSLNEEFCRDHLGATPGHYVLLSVSDTGVGMDRETLQHIFEPFFTTKGVGKGTGLGLASVYGIVKGLGGYIMCHSEPGQGSVFRIYLPAFERLETEVEGGTDEAPLPGGAETILVVDDEAPVREVASRILQHFGYKVLTADSGETALELYRTRRGEIDLVVLDLGMPGMGGHKCLRELSAFDPSVKVVVATGYSIDRQLRESLERGAVGFVGKPYQLRDLAITVRRVLDGLPPYPKGGG